jgi:hypothetical protein
MSISRSLILRPNKINPFRSARRHQGCGRGRKAGELRAEPTRPDVARWSRAGPPSTGQHAISREPLCGLSSAQHCRVPVHPRSPAPSRSSPAVSPAQRCRTPVILSRSPDAPRAAFTSAPAGERPRDQVLLAHPHLPERGPLRVREPVRLSPDPSHVPSWMSHCGQLSTRTLEDFQMEKVSTRRRGHHTLERNHERSRAAWGRRSAP